MTSLPGQGVLEANDGQALRGAAIKHLGILLQPMYITHNDEVAGRLVPVLHQHRLPDAAPPAGQGAVLCRLPGRAVRGE